MTFGKKKIIGLASIVFLVGILVVANRYSSKRLELYGHYDKVWAHRVNNLTKLESAEYRFEGVELDLTYFPQKNNLAVYHAGISTSMDLHFDEYVPHIENSDLNVWLDIKNLDQSNAAEIFELVEKTVNNSFYRNNKNKILVESHDPAALHLFLNHGYRASRYLPYGTKNLKNKDSLATNIKISLRQHEGLELSAHYSNYPFLKNHFPKTIKNIWILTSTYDPETFSNFSMIRELLKDSTVKAVLIPYINFNRYFSGE